MLCRTSIWTNATKYRQQQPPLKEIMMVIRRQLQTDAAVVRTEMKRGQSVAPSSEQTVQKSNFTRSKTPSSPGDDCCDETTGAT